MGFKFERLEVWQMSLEYSDLMYEIADRLPSTERFNLQSQILRAATSISLNIAEGSTSQTDAEQDRFLGYAIRSLIETVACLHLVHRRKYLPDVATLRRSYQSARALFIRLQAMRRSLKRGGATVREDEAAYGPLAPEPAVSAFDDEMTDSTPFDPAVPPSPSPIPGPRSAVPPSPSPVPGPRSAVPPSPSPVPGPRSAVPGTP